MREVTEGGAFAGACATRARRVRGACAVRARCVRGACAVRARRVRGACAVRARCVPSACAACAARARCVNGCVGGAFGSAWRSKGVMAAAQRAAGQQRGVRPALGLPLRALGGEAAVPRGWRGESIRAERADGFARCAALRALPRVCRRGAWQQWHTKMHADDTRTQGGQEAARAPERERCYVWSRHLIRDRHGACPRVRACVV